jgi:hypothetical protein
MHFQDWSAFPARPVSEEIAEAAEAGAYLKIGCRCLTDNKSSRVVKKVGRRWRGGALWTASAVKHRTDRPRPEWLMLTSPPAGRDSRYEQFTFAWSPKRARVTYCAASSAASSSSAAFSSSSFAAFSSSSYGPLSLDPSNFLACRSCLGRSKRRSPQTRQNRLLQELWKRASQPHDVGVADR